MIKSLRYLLYSFVGSVFFLSVFLLYFHLLAVQREKLPRQAAAPSSGYFVPGNDVEIFLQETGPKNGPVVLFVHGMGAWSEIWKDTMEAVSRKGYRTIAIDLPPFGFSERPDISKFDTRIQGRRILGVLHSLGISKAILVGHSFGGGPTLHAALLEPEIVDRLILVDIAADISPSISTTEIPALARIILKTDWLRNLMVKSTATNPYLTKTFFRSFVYKREAITDERVAMIHIPMRLEKTSEYLGRWAVPFATEQDKSLSEDLPKTVGSMKMPIDILWGDRDTVTPLSKGEELASALPGSRFHILEDVGHIPQLEDPDLFLSELEKCIQNK